MGDLDLTVYCVYWGDKYDKAYVYALKEMVDRNLTIPHEFVCITTDKFEGIQTKLPFVPYHGWWQKIGLFAPFIAQGPSLYFDLDVVITGWHEPLIHNKGHAKLICFRSNFKSWSARNPPIRQCGGSPEVYSNGREVGSHAGRGGFLPHCFR